MVAHVHTPNSMLSIRFRYLFDVQKIAVYLVYLMWTPLFPAWPWDILLCSAWQAGAIGGGGEPSAAGKGVQQARGLREGEAGRWYSQGMHSTYWDTHEPARNRTET